MFEAQLLIAKPGTPYSVYSPWFSRGGSNATFTLDVVELDGSGTELDVEAYTKNSEEEGEGGNVHTGTSINATGAGVSQETWLSSLSPGFKEMVRYKFTVTLDSGSGWVLFRMLSPVWWDDVSA